jgi:hypothetical protein
MKRLPPLPPKPAETAREPKRRGRTVGSPPTRPDCVRCGREISAGAIRGKLFCGALSDLWPTFVLCPSCGESLRRLLSNEPIAGPRPEKGHR